MQTFIPFMGQGQFTSSNKRSREGSQIGKGIEKGFFNRRNSSAKGPRPSIPQQSAIIPSSGLKNQSTDQSSAAVLPNLISPSEETNTLNEKTIHQESSHVSWDRKVPAADLKEPSAISLAERDKVETI